MSFLQSSLLRTTCLALPLLLITQGLLCANVIGEKSPLSTFNVSAKRIVWTSEHGVRNGETLLAKGTGQASLVNVHKPCVLLPPTDTQAGGSILLDFGVQIAGDVEIYTARTRSKTPPLVRVRLGESVAEAMSEVGEGHTAKNDHAIRDMVLTLPWLGKRIIGPSGFRFVRIDNVDPKLPVNLSEVRALLKVRDVPQIGSFECDDERLNKIWQVGAYTVHLNMQEYLYDGIKRDRLVWVGDMHPEVSTINAVFGYNDVVPDSLDYIRDLTPASKWMNNISSYSMWWILIHEQWWMHHGNHEYLEEQREYLKSLSLKLADLVGPDGTEQINGKRFLDWPSSSNQQGVTAGLQALLVMTLEASERMLTVLGEDATAATCAEAADRARLVVPDTNGSKSGAALLALAKMRSPELTAEDTLMTGGPTGISTFYGFYVLQALAKGGHADTAMDFISEYWGAMLDLGATTFWEDFNLEWAEGASPIDELVPEGGVDIHGDFGAYCYIGYRHSLCHGWASGPTAFLSETVLGITPLEPGFTKVSVAPQLGKLKWAQGSYPTPHGPIQVRHERKADGTIDSKVDAPDGVTVIME